MFPPAERLASMNTQRSSTLVHQIMTECFGRVSPHAIDRFSDSPRVRGIYAAVVSAFPDASFEPLWCVADADRAAVGGTITGTHQGMWHDVPATGREIQVLGTLMLELCDGGVLDLMVVTDSLAIAEQIGAVEPLGAKACAALPSYDPPSRAGRTPCGDAIFGPTARA